MRDELSIKVAESDKGSDHFDRFGWFPLFHHLEFGGVHEHLPISDHQSQVFHLHLVKGTLGEFEMEVFLLHSIQYLPDPFLAFVTQTA